jgi:hypothetical protein
MIRVNSSKSITIQKFDVVCINRFNHWRCNAAFNPLGIYRGFLVAFPPEPDNDAETNEWHNEHVIIVMEAEEWPSAYDLLKELDWFIAHGYRPCWDFWFKDRHSNDNFEDYFRIVTEYPVEHIYV